MKIINDRIKNLKCDIFLVYMGERGEPFPVVYGSELQGVMITVTGSGSEVNC